jgi:hypothetical protein
MWALRTHGELANTVFRTHLMNNGWRPTSTPWMTRARKQSLLMMNALKPSVTTRYNLTAGEYPPGVGKVAADTAVRNALHMITTKTARLNRVKRGLTLDLKLIPRTAKVSIRNTQGVPRITLEHKVTIENARPILGLRGNPWVYTYVRPVSSDLFEITRVPSDILARSREPLEFPFHGWVNPRPPRVPLP